MAYSQSTANALNQLLAQGLTDEQAFDQLGIPEDDAALYAVNEVGTPADNPNFGRVESSANLRTQSFDPGPVDPVTNPGYGEEDDPFEPDDRVGITEPVDGISPYGEQDDDLETPDTFGAAPVADTAGYADVGEVPGVTVGEFGGDPGLLPDQVEAQARAQAERDTKAALSEAQQQATLQQRFNQTTQGDWRVRIRLAPGASYLYQADPPGILAPLRASNGVIFPYTPTVQTSYQANYDKYDLVHSNYRGYFYRGSVVNEITINGVFTAQDTQEAAYVLAVIHFFRSVTKMFYGKDEFRGAPPPLVELSGFGEYQFNNHPCVVSSFNYSLPNTVDYIRVNPNNQGLNLDNRRSLVSSSPSGTIQSVISRLKNNRLPQGAEGGPTDLGLVNQTVAGTGQTTYVPTKLEIQLTMLPIQTRQQVSKQFSLKNFANGNLLRGGFW